MEIAAFLVGSASFMTSDELLALSHAMAQAGTQLSWDTPVVVDKHCIGGIPGNRTSMIVVPIVAAHGLTIPKTSSRAITSPAGTADTMEVLARVDLTVDEMKEVVKICHGCLVWGGHVNLSPADDILISVERPLSLDTREQMVASIMSKKIAAGATHLLIDLPVGTRSQAADRAGRDAATQTVRVRRRSLRHLCRSYHHRRAAADRQRHRSGAGSPGRHGRADERCGGARRSAREIAAASPPTCSSTIRTCAAERAISARANCSTVAPRSNRCTRSSKRKGRPAAARICGTLTADIVAASDGTVEAIDCLRLNRLARTAGAPIDKGAGIKIFKKIGDRVEAGERLYCIHAFEQSQFDLALAAAKLDSGYIVESRSPRGES